MGTSTIEWTDVTWNPVTGCDKVSEGCGLPRFEGDDTGGCYAMAMAQRLKAMEGKRIREGKLASTKAKYQFDGDPRTSGPGFGVAIHPDVLTAPLRWRKPRKVFVNSMSDLFHDSVSNEYIAEVFAIIAATPQHTYQILTKRHSRMRSLLNDEEFRHQVYDQAALYDRIGVFDPYRYADPGMIPVHYVEPTGRPKDDSDWWPLQNVWLGVSVENQRWADIRIPALLDTPASVRWISAEPLLGPVALKPSWLHGPARLAWVVAGGESGHRARPMDPAWARSLRDQCEAATVPFLFKQWGAWAPAGRGIGVAQHNIGREVLVGPPLDDMGQRQVMRRVGKHAAGRALDGRTWDDDPASGEVTPAATS